MTGFYIQIKNGLLEGKHHQRINEAIWLFLWLLDKMTIINHETGEGQVFGGKAIRFEDVAKDLDMSRATYKRWLNILREGGYISTVRTSTGLSITVYKAFKIFGQKVEAKQRLKKEPSTKYEPSDSPIMSHRMSKNEPSLYIDNTVDNTVDTITNVIEQAPVFGNEDINEGMERITKAYGHITKTELNRFALNRLYKKFGKEKTLRVWDFAQKYKDKPYCPLILNFMDLEEKWTALEAFATRAVQKPTSKSAVFMEEQV